MTFAFFICREFPRLGQVYILNLAKVQIQRNFLKKHIRKEKEKKKC